MLNMSDMVMLTSWVRPPPAAPWKARPMMRASMDDAVAQMMELPQNHATKSSRIGLRPQISEILDQIGAPAAFASRYAPPIQTKPDVPCSWSEIVGIIVATMDSSNAAMNIESWRLKVSVVPGPQGEPHFFSLETYIKRHQDCHQLALASCFWLVQLE